VLITTFVTLILPESYTSTARIKVEHDQTDIAGINDRGMVGGYDPYFIQTEFEIIQSEVILGKVVRELDLNTEWGRKYYAANGPLKTTESISLLKSRMDLRPVRNTSIIESRVFSENKDDAAKYANAIAEVYQDHRLQQRKDRTQAGIVALEQVRAENDESIRKIKAGMILGNSKPVCGLH
jgi:uncharacterized protein involved in exopolysaccharide biosynthesis